MGDVGYDVLVIGAGFAGLAAARELAKEQRESQRSSRAGTESEDAPALPPWRASPSTSAGRSSARLRTPSWRWPGTRLPDAADVHRGRQPDPLARAGALIFRHHPEARHLRFCSTSAASAGSSNAFPSRSRSMNRGKRPTRNWTHRRSAAGCARPKPPPPHDLMAIMARVTWGARTRRCIDAARRFRYVKAAAAVWTGCSTSSGRPAGSVPRRDPADRDEDGRGTGRQRGYSMPWCRGSVVGGCRRRDVLPGGFEADVQSSPSACHRLASMSLRRSPSAISSSPAGRGASKTYAAYERPFWRTAGIRARRCPTRVPYSSPSMSARATTAPVYFFGFVDSRGFDALPPDQRKERALAGFAAIFGDDA